MYFKILSLAMLGICSYADIRYRRIYIKNILLYGGLVFGGKVIHVWIHGAMNGAVDLGGMFLESFFSVVPGCVCFLISHFSKEAFGYGDSLLIIICGLALGFSSCIEVLFLAFLFSGIHAMVLFVGKKKSRKYEIAFVPYLFLGVLIAAVAL